MRVIDLDRDMSDVIPSAGSPDSEYLFRRMEQATLEALGPHVGARILDAAGGLGQDSRTLVRRGAWAVCAEPSRRMSALGREIERDAEGVLGHDTTPIAWARTWGEKLPFRSGTFDATFCKGALDHFDDPERCIGELARVTRPHGRVVLAVANFDSLACRLQRALDTLRPAAARAGRRSYQVPSDHFTRYDTTLLREQAARHLVIEEWKGISLLWGLRPWSALIGALGTRAARLVLHWADRVAAKFPAHSDVILVAGRPIPMRTGSDSGRVSSACDTACSGRSPRASPRP